MKGHFLEPLLRPGGERWALVHRPSGRVIADDLHTAFDSASRRRGLLKESAWPIGSALIIAPCQAVHTVGMRFAIDVVFATRAGRVVKVKERVPPWRVAAAFSAFAVIELPAGSLGGTVRAGEVLTVAATDASAQGATGVEYGNQLRSKGRELT